MPKPSLITSAAATVLAGAALSGAAFAVSFTVSTLGNVPRLAAALVIG